MAADTPEHPEVVHPLSAGIVLVRRFPKGWRCLVLRAYRNWDFPKGMVDQDETPREAAIREVTEETGLDDLHFHWGEQYRETLPYAGRKIARYYLAEVPTGDVHLLPSAELGRPEHDEFRWVTFDEAEDLLPPRLALVLDWARAAIEPEAPSE